MIKKYQNTPGPLPNIGPQIRAAKQAAAKKLKDDMDAVARELRHSTMRSDQTAATVRPATTTRNTNVKVTKQTLYYNSPEYKKRQKELAMRRAAAESAAKLGSISLGHVGYDPYAEERRQKSLQMLEDERARQQEQQGKDEAYALLNAALPSLMAGTVINYVKGKPISQIAALHGANRGVAEIVKPGELNELEEGAANLAFDLFAPGGISRASKFARRNVGWTPHGIRVGNYEVRNPMGRLNTGIPVPEVRELPSVVHTDYNGFMKFAGENRIYRKGLNWLFYDPKTGLMNYFTGPSPYDDVRIAEGNRPVSSNVDVEVIDPDVRVVGNSGRRATLPRLMYLEPEYIEPMYEEPMYEEPVILDDPAMHDPNFWNGADYFDDGSAAIFDIFKKGGLIPKKQTGGLIPKFLKPSGKLKKINTLHGGIYVDETGAMYRTRSPLMGLPGIQYERIANPGLDYVYTDLGGRHRITSTGKYSHVSSNEGAKLRSMSKEAQEKEVSNLKNSKRLTRRGTYYNKLLQDGRWYHDLGNGRIDVANSDGTNTAYYMGSNGKYVIGTGPANPQQPASPTNKPALPTTTGGSGRRSRRTSSRVSGSKPISTPMLPASTPEPEATYTPTIPKGMEYASDYLTASPENGSAEYKKMADNILDRTDATIAAARPTISSALDDDYTKINNAMQGWDLKRKNAMIEASKGTLWDFNTEEGRKNFLGMANLMKNGKENYKKTYDKWMASLSTPTTSPNIDYKSRFANALAEWHPQLSISYKPGSYSIMRPLNSNLTLNTNPQLVQYSGLGSDLFNRQVLDFRNNYGLTLNK